MIVMKQKQKEILKLEEEFKDKIEIDIEKEQKEDKKVTITNIKLAGKANWQDKINGKTISENVFIVEIEITEIKEDGHERKTKQEKIYLGEEHIAGRIVGYNEETIFNPNFEKFEIDKYIAVNNLLNKVSEKAIEENSLNTLRRKEISEILSAQYGRQISEEEVEKLIKEKEASKSKQKQKEQEGKEEQEEKDNQEDQLSEKQSQNIKVRAIQRVDLSKLVDGKQTLAKRLDLEGYDDLYIISTENVNEINPEAKRNNTTYSLVGMTNDGEAKVLNDEFEMDKSVGSSASRNSTKIRANNTATRDNKDLSVYTRKSNGASIGCENNQGNVDVFYYQKTLKENENIGIQVETSKTKAIPLETRELLSGTKGTSQKDKIQDEVEKHIGRECNPNDKSNLNDIRDFDGDEKTSSHEHIDSDKIDRDDYIPNTNMKWGEFIDRCGYRGEGELEKAVEVVSKMPKVDEESLEEFIEEIEEKYEEDIMHRE